MRSRQAPRLRDTRSFSVREKVAQWGAFHTEPSPRPYRGGASASSRKGALRIGLAGIALRAGVGVSRGEHDGRRGRRTTGQGHGHKKNQQILHGPQTRRPPSTLRPPKAPDTQVCQGQVTVLAVQISSERGHTMCICPKASNGYWALP
jgi:hypothetical protein